MAPICFCGFPLLQCLTSNILAGSPFPSHPTGRSVFPSPAVRQSSSHSMRRLSLVPDDSAPDVEHSPGVQNRIGVFLPPKCEQEIVIDRIKIPLDVGVYYPPTSQQHFVDCADCLRRTAPRSKPVRLVLEVRFEDWLDYYPTRLLDDPVSHCRNPQGPLTAIRLGNVYPQHRLGLVPSCLQIRRYYLEKRCHALSLHLFQAHAIDAGTAC